MIKTFRSKEAKNQQKHQEFNERYSKDLVATKAKLRDLEEKCSSIEKHNKQLMKEKEAAVVALAQVKAQYANREGQIEASLGIKSSELETVRNQ